MHLNLRDQQLKIVMHIYIYTHILYIAIYILYIAIYKPRGNQKSIIDTHKKERKESKHNSKDSHQITREVRKRRAKRTTKKP